MGEDDPRTQTGTALKEQGMLFKRPTSTTVQPAAVMQTHPGEGKLWREAHHLNTEEGTKR